MNLHKTLKGKKMKKLASTLIFLTTYGIGQTSAFAHGGHGAETSLVHLFTEPQHAMGLIAAGLLVAVIITLLNRLHTFRIKK
jgi:hypothetical protein